MQDAPLDAILADSPVIAAFANNRPASEEVWESPVYEEVLNDDVTLETLGKSSGYASQTPLSAICTPGPLQTVRNIQALHHNSPRC